VLAIDDLIAPALEHVDDQALVPMLAPPRPDVVDKDAPVLQRRILESHRVDDSTAACAGNCYSQQFVRAEPYFFV
jgi:hypothetical protein